MAFFDMPLEALQGYKPERTEPADFDSFWQSTLAETRQHPLNAQFKRVDYGMKIVETYDVTFSGYGGQPVKGWLYLPTGRERPLPCVIEYLGYGGGRGLPNEWLTWPSAGYALLVMDTRGQGSTWRRGDTPDMPVDGANPFHPGFMTQGILDPRTYYYRRVFTDAVRAIETARSHSAVDPARVAVTGKSQGGGIAIAASALVLDVPVCMPDVPYLCHFARAIGLATDGPYLEIVGYLRVHREKEQQVLNTLTYFDGMNFAARTRARALYSTALMDTICPPSTVFAAYNQVETTKAIKVYTYNEHDGGGPDHDIEKIRYLDSLWG